MVDMGIAVIIRPQIDGIIDICGLGGRGDGVAYGKQLGRFKRPRPSPPLFQCGHVLLFSLLIVMLHRPSSPVMHNRLRSKPHPVPPQRVGRLFGTNENAPVRPPRNPARPVTSGEAQLTSPSPWSNPTRPSEDVGNHREERHKPSVNVRCPHLPEDRVQIAIQQPLTLIIISVFRL